MPPSRTTCCNVICQWLVLCLCYEHVVCPTVNPPFCASIVQFVVDKVQCYREPNARLVVSTMHTVLIELSSKISR